MINGTVLGVAPVKTSLLVMGGLISVFCTLIEPQVSAGLSLLPRFAFWVSHVSVGLSGILLASLILSRCWPQKKLSLLVTIGLTGMLGTLLATPGLLLVEEFFPEEIDETDFEEVRREAHEPGEKDDHPFVFRVLERRARV